MVPGQRLAQIVMAARLVTALVTGLFAVKGFVSALTNLGNDGIDYDCGQFANQEDARAYFDGDGGRVDRNVDGLDSPLTQHTPDEPDGFCPSSRAKESRQRPLW